MHKNHLTIVLLLITIKVCFGGVLKLTGDMVFDDLLTSISCNTITCPVKITAKSNIKTNQRASWVGLGFDLSVPYIERVAIGSADEKANTPFYLDRLANNNDCFQPGVFDKNRSWEPLLKPNTNGYQGKYVFQPTCPGTDFASGYKTEMNEFFQTMLDGKCNIAFTVDDAGEIKDLPNSSLTVHQELANSLGIGIGKGIGKGNINTSDFKISKSDIDALYKQYPRKEGKSKGIDKLLADLKTPQDIEDYKRAQLKYVQSCTQKKTEAKYIKLFSSFVNCWRDWLDDDAGTVALKKPDIVSEMKAKLDDYENRRAAL